MKFLNQFFNRIAFPFLCLILTMFFLFKAEMQAQNIQIAPEIWSVAGDHYTANDFEMSWTIGEVAIETFVQSEFILTQGFHQSEDVFLNVYNEKQQRIVITPNDDGLNDAFVLEDLPNYSENELIILNRWGSTVFREKPYSNTWRGTGPSGKPLPEGTYYFIVRMDISKNEILYGSVTIKH